MTTRTVKIFGQGFGSAPAEILVTLNGNTIYTGAISTIDQPVYTLPNLELTSSVPELCNFEIDMDFSGTMPMTCEVLGGTVIFAQILANYYAVANTDPVVGSEPNIIKSTGPNVFKDINGISDPRLNVFVNNVAHPINHNEEFSGPWWFTVPAGSVLAYDLAVRAGKEPPPAP